MKTLHLVLVFSLFTAPLYSTNNKRDASKGNNDAALIMIGITIAVFAGVKLYEWYKQPSTPDKNTKDTQKPSTPLDLKTIPEKTTSIRTDPFLEPQKITLMKIQPLVLNKESLERTTEKLPEVKEPSNKEILLQKFDGKESPTKEIELVRYNKNHSPVAPATSVPTQQLPAPIKKPETAPSNIKATPIAQPTKIVHKSDRKIHGADDNDPFN